jgi:hypothetical protein
MLQISASWPRWDGPFPVSACPGPNAYTLALPSRMLCSPIVNVDRLKPLFERDGVDPAPGPVSDVGQEGEHKVELLLNRTEKRGVARYLVRWRGHTSADDEWLRGGARALPGEGHGGGVRCCGPTPSGRLPWGIGHRCGSQARRSGRRPGGAATSGPGRARPDPPAGYRVALATEVRSGKALVGHWVLYCWPAEGWVRGRVVRVSRAAAAGFSHVVGYGPTSRSALGAAAVASLLDAAAHGPAGRWVLLMPTR